MGSHQTAPVRVGGQEGAKGVAMMKAKDKTKVLFVVLQLDVGGSERVVFDLAKNLDREQFDVYVAAFKSGVLAEPLKSICTDVFFIEKKTGLDLSAMFRLAGIIRKLGIDVVNAHHYMPCFYSFLGTKILNDKRLVYTEHSVPEVEGIANSYHGKIFNCMLYRINAVVGVSRAITETFKNRYPRHAVKFHKILNGVDIDKFKGKGAREEVRSRFGLRSDQFVVGTVANFRNVKNHVCLVRAAARLKDSHPQLRLLFVGTGFPEDPENSEAEVRELICELGLQDKVVLAGYQENIPEMLSTFDVFCLPSFSEGLPVSVLEAMAARVPVIGSEVKGIDEIVTPGQTGIVFPTNDDGILAEKIKELMERPGHAKMIADRAFGYVEGNHAQLAWVTTCSDILIKSQFRD